MTARCTSRQRALRLGGALAALLAVVSTADLARAGAFTFAGVTHGVDVVTHPRGYTGQSGVLDISVCIDPSSPHASEMRAPVLHIVETLNALEPVVGNIVSGSSNDVPSGHFDFESVAVHELGHGLGLAHPNLASESGLSGNSRNYTRSTKGPDGGYDLSDGADNVIGSADDRRDDDENLHWFRVANNDPFTLAGRVDATTYSRDPSDLPGSDRFPANADRSVGALLGAGSSEAVMQQGTFVDEAQRELNHDDVATLRYAMSGLDELEGTGDDYLLRLSYVGLTRQCDAVFDFDDSETSFAVSVSSGAYVGDTNHIRVTSTEIFFNDDYKWWFRSQCGDGLISGSEACDDGATSSGDGCSAGCAIEAGWQCSGEPSLCSPFSACGDSAVAGEELCDDGNTVGGDCCSATCQLEAAGSACDDGDACTQGDTCNGSGQCGSGLPHACNDGEPCTDDGCDPQGGCVFTPRTGACDDGDACTQGDACVNGACVAGGVLPCSDGETCTIDSCDPGVGCIFLPRVGGCDDGDLCSVGDYCTSGSCLAGPAQACDDLDPCTADSCDALAGCLHEPMGECEVPEAVPGLGPWARILSMLALLAGAPLARAERRSRRGRGRPQRRSQIGA